MNTTSRNHFRNTKTAPQARRIALAIPILLSASGTLEAEQTTTEAFDSLWSLATLYKDDTNPILEEFKLRGRYQGQFHSTDADREPGDFILGRCDDIVSATFWVKQGVASVVFEAFNASGGNGADSDLFGFFIQPTYDIVPGKLQLVGRYAYSESDGATGVRPQNRYETPAGALRGDSYHAFYLGGQYFIYGDKLKLLAGVEYSILGQKDTGDRYDGLTALAGLRFSF